MMIESNESPTANGYFPSFAEDNNPIWAIDGALLDRKWDLTSRAIK